jgi:ABC-type multidrug transport system fused ATPase/permease subunit
MKKYFSILLRLWNLLKPFHGDFYIQLASIIAQQISGILVTFILAKILDVLVTKNISTLTWMLILFPIVTIFKNRISYYTDKHSLKKIEGAIQQYLEEYSFKKIFTLNIAQYREDHSAIKLQVINRGEGAIETIVSTIVLTFLPTVLQITFVIITISFYSKTIALVSLATVITVLFWTNHFTKFHRPFIKKNIDNWDTQRKVRTEAFQHLSLIKLLSSESVYLKKYLANRNTLLKHHILTWDMNLIHFYRRDLLLIISRTTSFVLIVTFYLQSLITLGAVYALWSWINEVYGNVQSIAKTLRQIPLRFVELEKYLEIIDKQALFNEEGLLPFSSGDIVFKNVSFKYPLGEKNILTDFNLTIPQGKKVAFVGHSGSGKSTIVGLLLRIYDFNAGTVIIGGVNLHDMSASSLRKNIGYVEQHVDLFDDTIKENILVGISEKDRDLQKNSLEEVAKKARIDQFYSRLGAKKFDTFVGERGIKVSGGERQRIGIARAIIKNPEILIFDEATSALDSENERYVMEAIREVSQGKTTLIIAHRLSTVRDADKIIVMDKGQIVGEGTHDELMQSNTVYQNLITHQVSS